MAKILLLETATDICSVGFTDGPQLVAMQRSRKTYQHASQITLLIQEVLGQAGAQLPSIDAVAISSGPGSYTSLRVGAATAKGICYSLDKPLIVVDTLKALALATLREVREEGLYYPMIDARRMEVYTAGYDAANEQIEAPHALVVKEDSFKKQTDAGQLIILSGNGAEKCQQVLPADGFVYSKVLCSAAHLHEPALMQYEQSDFEDIAYYSPMYLKPPNITKSKKRL